MKGNLLLSLIVSAFGLTLTTSAGDVIASQYDRQIRSTKQVEMLDRHQAEMKALREKQNAEIKEMHKIHRAELTILKEQQRKERRDFRMKR